MFHGNFFPKLSEYRRRIHGVSFHPGENEPMVMTDTILVISRTLYIACSSAVVSYYRIILSQLNRNILLGNMEDDDNTSVPPNTSVPLHPFSPSYTSPVPLLLSVKQMKRRIKKC